MQEATEMSDVQLHYGDTMIAMLRIWILDLATNHIVRRLQDNAKLARSLNVFGLQADEESRETERNRLRLS
jgi:hypothetical protein